MRDFLAAAFPFGLGFFPVFASASIAAAMLGLSSFWAMAVSAGVLCLAQIVLAAQVLSLFDGISYGGFIAVHWSCLLLAVVAWRARDTGVRDRHCSAPGRRVWTAKFRDLPWDLRVLSVLTLGAYAALLVLCVTVAPSTPDSMTYHLARAAYWIQHATIAVYETPEVRQVVFPPNAEIGVMWTMVLAGSDRFASLVQWAAAIVGAFSIFGIIRLGDWGTRAGLFATLLWLCFPGILLQSTTTQNDLVAAALCVATAYLLFLGSRRGSPSALVVGGLAAGLAVGTKLTSLLLLPVVFAGSVLMAIGRLDRRGWITFATAGVLGFATFGAPIYVSNVVHFGHPLGPPAWVALVGNQGSTNAELVVTNLARYTYDFLDLTGLPFGLAAEIQPWKEASGRAVFGVLGLDPRPAVEKTIYPPFQFEKGHFVPHEDGSWFGPLGAVILLAGLLIGGVRGVRRGDGIRLTLALAATAFVVLASTVLSWNPWAGRHFVVFATIAAPLIADCWGEKPSGALIRTIAVLSSIVIVGITMLANATKPLVGSRPILMQDRVGQMSSARPSIEPVLRRFEELLPVDAKVGLIPGGDAWHYPFFGEHLRRRVTLLDPQPDISQRLEALDLDVLIVDESLWRGPRFSIDHRHTRVGHWRIVELESRSVPRVAGEFSREPARIGLFRGGRWIIDDGNGAWDGCAIDACFSLGQVGDEPVVGYWDGEGSRAGLFRAGLWLIDDGDGRWEGCDTDRCMGPFGREGDRAMMVKWGPAPTHQMTVIRRGAMFTDDGNDRWDDCAIDRCDSLGAGRGQFQVGDWDGDGIATLAIRDGRIWQLGEGDRGPRGCDLDRCIEGPEMSRDSVAIVGDWNGDGKDDVGTFHKGTWQLDNGNGVWEGCEIDYCYPSFGLPGDQPFAWYGPPPGGP